MAHERFCFADRQLVWYGLVWYGLDCCRLGGGCRWGFEGGIKVAILGPQREDLAEQLGQAMSEAEVVFLAVGAESREQGFDRWVPSDGPLSGGVAQASHEVVAFTAQVDFGSVFGIPLAVGSRNIDFFGEAAEVPDQGAGRGEAFDADDLGDERGGGLPADAGNRSPTGL